MTENPFEIPQALRDVSERNLKQAHAAYEQITDFMAKAMGAWTGAGALPSNPMAAVFKDVQDRATQIARENAESVFTFAGKISNVRTPQDIVTLQTQFAHDQMQAYVTQTQQLFSVIEEALQQLERGAMGASMGALPSNPMPAGFKDVQGRAMQIAMENAEVSFRAGRKDRQGTKFPGGFDTSNSFCSRPDAGLRHADAGASKADRGSSPEAATRLSFLMKEQHRHNKREPDLFQYPEDHFPNNQDDGPLPQKASPFGRRPGLLRPGSWLLRNYQS